MTIRSLVRCMLAVALIPVGLLAQDAPLTPDLPAVSITGRSRIVGGSTSPLPSSSSLPERYVRWEFQPSVSLFGVPVSAHILLTTENDPSRRAINSAEVIFDVQAFRQMLRQRVMATAKEVETDFRARAEQMREKLSDPATAANLARFNQLQELDTIGLLADSAREELESLRAQTEEARQMAETAERYASMNPEQMAKEKERELKALQREIADPSKLESKLEEMNLLSGVEGYLMGIQDLGIGVTYPQYSPMILTGVPVNGASFEYTLGIFTVAAAGGSMNGPIPDGRFARETFDRSLVAGRIGLGATNGTHFHVIGLYATDDSATAPSDSIYTPARNHVLAVDGKLELFDRAVSIAAQAAGSMYTRDLDAPAIEVSASDDPTGLNIINGLDPKISTSVDYAWTAETALNLFGGATRASAAVKMVGPGYTSLGVPYMRTDLLGQEGKLEQRLFDGQINVGGYFKRNDDNVVPWKRTRVGDEWLPARTRLTSYGAQLGLQFRNLPYLRVEYAPFVQQTDIEGDTTGADNRTTLVSASAGYGYRLFGLSGSTTATAMSQTGTSNSGRYDFVNRIYLFNQSIAFSFPVSLMAGVSYTETDVLNMVTTITAITGSGSFRIAEMINTGLSLTYSSRNDGGRRLGFSARVALKLWSYGTFEMRAERNAYQSGIAPGEDYEQIKLRGMLTTRW